MSDRPLENKVALVTGSGRGIGRAIAIGYAKAGAKLILVSRTGSELEKTATVIREDGGQAETLVCDVTDVSRVDEMADGARKAFGRLDILFNNAGGGRERNVVSESDPALWIETVHVNCTSAYLVSRALLPLLVDSGGGHIINMGSGMGHSSGAGSSAYRVGKAGMWMLTRCLAEEVWEQGINVNELIPGPVATELTAGRMKIGGPPPFAPSEVVKRPEDVVSLALWLATQGPGGPTAQSFSLTRRPI